MVLTKPKVYGFIIETNKQKKTLIISLKMVSSNLLVDKIKLRAAFKMSELVMISMSFHIVTFKSKKSWYFLIICNQYF